MRDIDRQLVAAAKCCSTGDVVSLIAAGADAKLRDADGATLLMTAIRNRHAACFAALLPHSDPRAVDVHGCSALIHACRRSALDCASALVPLSDVDHRDHGGRTALDHAEASGYTALVNLLRAWQESLEIGACVRGGVARAENKRL